MFNNVIIDVFYNGDSELWSPQECHPYSFDVENDKVWLSQEKLFFGKTFPPHQEVSHKLINWE